MIKNKVLLIISITFSLLFIEIFCTVFLFKKDNYDYKKRYLIFNEGKVFRNIENFFTYHPNKKIKTANYYYSEGKFTEVYNYEIHTNNMGLVQKNDISEGISSILFLGDSFTEGQGSESWIDYFEGNYKDYQIINGGLLGTGFQQFELLEKFLSRYDIKKVFVLFIGDDLRRNIFGFNPQQLECLEDHSTCLGTEGFYGFPIEKKNPQKFLTQLKNKKSLIEEEINFKLIRRKIKSMISNLYIIKIPLDFLRSNFYESKNEKMVKNFNSIKKLIKLYEKDIFFVHLKMKAEITNKKKSYESIYVEKNIKDLTSNYYECKFDNDLKNFYVLDSHPNSKGYKNLFTCVINILKNENI